MELCEWCFFTDTLRERPSAWFCPRALPPPKHCREELLSYITCLYLALMDVCPHFVPQVLRESLSFLLSSRRDGIFDDGSSSSGQYVLHVAHCCSKDSPRSLLTTHLSKLTECLTFHCLVLFFRKIPSFLPGEVRKGTDHLGAQGQPLQREVHRGQPQVAGPHSRQVGPAAEGSFVLCVVVVVVGQGPDRKLLRAQASISKAFISRNRLPAI